jgi:hypothetical protein
MIAESQSLWLPVGRANFFSVPEDREFVHLPNNSNEITCSAGLEHHPNLQVSTMRRLLEVLPAFYGYDANAQCESTKLAEEGQPVKVTLSLSPHEEYTGPDSHRRTQANRKLVRAEITKVELTATEDGFYTWTAESSADDEAQDENRYGDTARERVRNALRTHIKEVFGGDFSLQRDKRDGQLPGDRAAEIYRGTDGTERRSLRGGVYTDRRITRDVNVHRFQASAPLGILTFFQLNTLLEGLINETLIPAVFFEEYAFLKEWTDKNSANRGFRSIGSFIELLLVDVDATSLGGQITALDHFLAVTSREVLQKIKWSVESVRRGLLDEMMSVLHRQSSLPQLGLGRYEQSPEQAGDANESQLRGYVMLVAAKLPLITNVERYASGTLARLKFELACKDSQPKPVDGNQESPDPVAVGISNATFAQKRVAAPRNGELPERYMDLEYQLTGWRGLVNALEDNIAGLEKAIEHAWMERLLYEQEQVRAEQEAMAEIERSRAGRRPLISPETAINAAVLVFAVATVVLTAQSATNPSATHSLWDLLLPPSLFGLAVLAAAVGWTVFTKYIKVWRRRTDVYDYEFAFRLDAEVDQAKVQRFLELSKPERISDTEFHQFKILRRGGARIERITPDSSLVKLHSAITFRPNARFLHWSRARFEIVTEILGHRVSNKNQYILRESRIFGDTSSPMAPDKVVALVSAALHVTAGRIVSEALDVEKVLNLATPVFYDKPPAEDGDNPAAVGTR